MYHFLQNIISPVNIVILSNSSNILKKIFIMGFVRIHICVHTVINTRIIEVIIVTSGTLG